MAQSPRNLCLKRLEEKDLPVQCTVNVECFPDTAGDACFANGHAGTCETLCSIPSPRGLVSLPAATCKPDVLFVTRIAARDFANTACLASAFGDTECVALFVLSRDC